MSADPPAGIEADPGFRARWRGYDRQQVDSYRRSLEAELAATRNAHERAMYANARTTGWLRAAQNDLGRLRSELAGSPTALSDRLREILHLAAQDAEQTRAEARAEADLVRSHAHADAEALLKQARDMADGIVTDARAEQQRVATELAQARAEAEQARERDDAQAAARRNAADEQARMQREQADAAAAARLSDMSRQLADLTRHRDELLNGIHRMQHSLASVLETSSRQSTGPGGSPTPPAGPLGADS